MSIDAFILFLFYVCVCFCIFFLVLFIFFRLMYIRHNIICLCLLMANNMFSADIANKLL